MFRLALLLVGVLLFFTSRHRSPPEVDEGKPGATIFKPWVELRRFGWGPRDRNLGINVGDEDYASRIQERCRRKGLLVVAARGSSGVSDGSDSQFGIALAEHSGSFARSPFWRTDREPSEAPPHTGREALVASRHVCTKMIRARPIMPAARADEPTQEGQRVTQAWRPSNVWMVLTYLRVSLKGGIAA